MEDKDFLGYFNQLGNKNPQDVKKASNNIVATLLALDTKPVRKMSAHSASSDSEEEESKKITNKVQSALKKKYSKGDLGDKMTADLNYSLKRLVGGLCSDNHTVK
jgi:hypothetical protein